MFLIDLGGLLHRLQKRRDEGFGQPRPSNAFHEVLEINKITGSVCVPFQNPASRKACCSVCTYVKGSPNLSLPVRVSTSNCSKCHYSIVVTSLPIS